MTTAPSPSDGAALPRRFHWSRRRLVQAILVLAAALLAYVVFAAYRDPAMVIDLSRAFVFC